MAALPVPKFNIDDVVWYARVIWTETRVPCPDCLGQKEWTVTTPAGESFQHMCMTCSQGYYSNGLVSEYGDKPDVRPMTIGSVRLDTAEAEDPVKYMCRETGVGSGSIYPERQLFALEDAATTWAAEELIRVKGRRQSEVLESRKRHKDRPLIYGQRKKKS